MTGQTEDMAGRPDNLGLPTSGSDGEMAALYAEFAEEDRLWAESGMPDYAAGLAREDDA